MENEFLVWQPNSVDLTKSLADTEGDDYGIRGYVSTAEKDRQGEELLQRGLDFTEFLNYGFFNDNHSKETAATLGIPEKVEYHAGKGWFTVGEFLRGYSAAEKIRDLAKSLRGTRRRLGFSVEGKVIERVGEKIVKAVVRHIAITNSPVNTSCTWELFAKSFGGDVAEKALSVGAAVGPNGGSILVPEDLEKDEIHSIFKCPKCNAFFAQERALDNHIAKKHAKDAKEVERAVSKRSAKELTKSEAFDFICKTRPELSGIDVLNVLSFVFNRKQGE